MEKSGWHDRSLSVGRIWRTLWKVDSWGSPDGIMEARTAGGVQKDVAQGQKPEELWESRPLMNFDWGYFISNTSLPTFEFGFQMKEVQRNFYSRSCLPQFSYSIVPRYFGVWCAGAGVFSNRGNPKRFFRNSHWSIALGTVQ